MMRNPVFTAMLWLLLVVLFASCGKDKDTKAAEDIYIVSPEKMMDMAGKDWEALKPGLQDKKGYWYTGFTQDQNPAVKAVISLPAIEETNHNIDYNITINIDRFTNKDNGPIMYTDTLTKLSFGTAASLMLEYYNRSLAFTGDTVRTYGQYITTGGLDGSGHTNTTVTDVVDKLNSGVVADQYVIEVDGADKGFNVVITKNENDDSYWFSFQSYDF